MKYIVLILLIWFPLLSAELLTTEGAPSEELLELFELLEMPRGTDLKAVTDLAQRSWYEAGKERWELRPKHENRRGEIMPILSKIGCTDAILPSSDIYDHVLVHGALGPTMKKRLEYLSDLLEHGLICHKIWLLTGDRDLNPELESFPSSVSNESELFLYHYQHLIAEKFPSIPFELVHAEKQRDGRSEAKRPETLHTLHAWLEKKATRGTCLFISNQPYIGYQDAVVRLVLPSCFSIETVGPRASSLLSISVFLDDLARWLYVETRIQNISQ